MVCVCVCLVMMMIMDDGIFRQKAKKSVSKNSFLSSLVCVCVCCVSRFDGIFRHKTRKGKSVLESQIFAKSILAKKPFIL